MNYKCCVCGDEFEAEWDKEPDPPEGYETEYYCSPCFEAGSDIDMAMLCRNLLVDSGVTIH